MTLSPDQNPFGSRLPSGKANPEYVRWWRTNTEAGRESVRKSNLKHRGPGVKRRGSYKPKVSLEDRTVSCAVCRSTYRYANVLERGWRMIGNFGTVCDLCL